ncbi:hypothetical protein P863_06635, partial [Mycobacterium numidiamassiliense]
VPVDIIPSNRYARRHLDTPTPVGRRWASTNGVAEYLGVAARTVKNMIADGRLPSYRLGRLVRIDLAEVDAALEASRK